MKARSAISGRKVKAEYAKRNPATTVVEGKSKDSIRLDAIAKNKWGVFPWQKEWCVVAVGRTMAYDKSLRRAIDKAIAASK